nr:hypothetical protein [Tanacetum cinerariifolium]
EGVADGQEILVDAGIVRIEDEPPPLVLTAVVATTNITYIPKWNVINDSALDDPKVCQSMVDQLAPPGFFSQLWGMDYDQLFAEFNIGVAHHTCFSAKENDTKIENLKAQLSLKDAKAAEAIHLRSQVAAIECTKAAQVDEVDELDCLKEQNSALDKEKNVLEKKVAVLKSADAAKETELMSLSTQTAKLTIVGRRWILGRGLRLVVMKCLQSPKYLAALRGAIGRAIDKGMQDGLVAGIDHGKVERGLVDDVDMADIMGLLHLDGPAAETPEADQLQPSLEQLMLPIHRPEDQVVIRETSLSFSLDVVHARVRRIRG